MREKGASTQGKRPKKKASTPPSAKHSRDTRRPTGKYPRDYCSFSSLSPAGLSLHVSSRHSRLVSGGGHEGGPGGAPSPQARASATTADTSAEPEARKRDKVVTRRSCGWTTRVYFHVERHWSSGECTGTAEDCSVEGRGGAPEASSQKLHHYLGAPQQTALGPPTTPQDYGATEEGRVLYEFTWAVRVRGEARAKASACGEVWHLDEHKLRVNTVAEWALRNEVSNRAVEEVVATFQGVAGSGSQTTQRLPKTWRTVVNSVVANFDYSVYREHSYSVPQGLGVSLTEIPTVLKSVKAALVETLEDLELTKHGSFFFSEKPDGENHEVSDHVLQRSLC